MAEQAPLRQPLRKLVNDYILWISTDEPLFKNPTVSIFFLVFSSVGTKKKFGNNPCDASHPGTAGSAMLRRVAKISNRQE